MHLKQYIIDFLGSIHSGNLSEAFKNVVLFLNIIETKHDRNK